MNLNLGALKQIANIENDLWIGKDKITNIKKDKTTGIRYTPSSPLFEKEFGISDLQTFMKMLVMYQEPSISFNKADLVISKKDFSGALTYRMTTETAMKFKIELCESANKAFDNCSKFIETGAFYKFTIDENLMNEIKASSSFIRGKDASTFIKFEKDSTDDDLRIVVYSPGCENISTLNIKGENTAALGSYSKQLNIDAIPTTGTWDFYIFESHNIEVKNKKGDKMKVAVKDTFLYGRSFVGEGEEKEMLEWYSVFKS